MDRPGPEHTRVPAKPLFGLDSHLLTLGHTHLFR